MSRNLSISGSLLSVFIVAAAVSAVGCVGGSAEGDNIDESGSAVCAGAPDWQQGHNYNIGDKVAYKGSIYVATHENPGYDPTISTWFWSPAGTCSSGGTSGGTCAPAWQQGHNYITGDKVIFNGAEYVATHDNPGYDPTISTWFWSPTGASCGGTSGGGTSGGGSTSGGSGFGAVISSSVFNQMFPNRNQFYTYNALVAAANTFPGLGTTGDDATRKREVAAFLANVAHETGGLVYIEEIQKAAYCDTSWGPPGCGCAAGKQYYGRGPLQLSWNGNYCAAGNALNLPLMNDPDLLSRDATASFRTGFWFWTTQKGAGTMTAHDAIVNNRGFGETIRTINGSLECGGKNTAEMQDRINFYNKFTNMLGVSAGGNTGC